MRWNGASHCELVGKSMESETTTWTEFPNGGKSIVEQILASEERNKSKGAGLWESQSGIQVRKLTIWVRSFEIKNYNSSPSRSAPLVLMIDIEVSKDKNIRRWVDQEWGIFGVIYFYCI